MHGTLFFDLDGTLTDPFEGITRSIQFALEKLGEEVPEADALAWCIGPPLLENFTRLLGAERAPRAVELYRERFGEVGLYENTPYPGIRELLEALARDGRTLCVASSKPHVYVRRILEHFELDGSFAHIFGSELDGTRTDKRDLLAWALRQSDTRAEDATMIGDRRHDIEGALHNGVDPVGVLYGYGSLDELRGAGAERWVASPAELAALLR